MQERGRSRRGKPRKPWLAMAAAAMILLAVPITAAAVIRGFGAEKENRTEGEVRTEGKVRTEEENWTAGKDRAEAEAQAAGEIRTEGEKDRRDETPVLGGAELTMLKSQSKGQMMSFLLETKEGSLIVIDGGRWDDGDYLVEQIKARGGHVSAWLLTHTHTDHVGALIKILQNEADGEGAGIQIDNFYYNFASTDWYALHDQEELGTAYTIAELLKTQSPEKLHAVGKGHVISVDEVEITVMNDRYEPDENHVGDNDGNDAGLAYRAVVNGRSILFLGDLGEVTGQMLLDDVGPEGLKSDMVQMAHHGQNGVGEAVYRAVDPSVCLWPTPQWLWDNEGDRFRTPETKAWVQKLNVEKHYCTKDGDQVIR